MKYKLITVIVLLVLMLAGGIWECVYITKTFRELEQRTNEILSEDAIDKQRFWTPPNGWTSSISV